MIKLLECDGHEMARGDLNGHSVAVIVDVTIILSTILLSVNPCRHFGNCWTRPLIALNPFTFFWVVTCPIYSLTLLSSASQQAPWRSYNSLCRKSDRLLVSSY
ncbi:hypothetical protein F4824DRAFT_444092 [Ustulina deusta]|nr:hypothetical protein F4824DRAFT_444092 [Ustulina deusta]